MSKLSRPKWFRPSPGQAYRAVMSAAFLVAIMIVMGWLG